MAKTQAKAGERRMVAFRLPLSSIGVIRQIGRNLGLSATDVVLLGISHLSQGRNDEPVSTDDQLDLFCTGEASP